MTPDDLPLGELVALRRWAIERAMLMLPGGAAASDAIPDAAALEAYVLCGTAFDDSQNAGEQSKAFVQANLPARSERGEGHEIKVQAIGDGLSAVAGDGTLGHVESSVGCVEAPTLEAVTRTGNGSVTASPTGDIP